MHQVCFEVLKFQALILTLDSISGPIQVSKSNLNNSFLLNTRAKIFVILSTKNFATFELLRKAFQKKGHVNT